MFCASSSPTLVSWDEWTANCPTNITSTTTYFPSNAGVTLPSNTSIPCYAGSNPRSWPNGTFSAVAASDIAAISYSDLTGAASSCASSASSHKTPVGAIVGGVVGGAVLLLLVCGCVLFVTLRRRRRAKSSPEITRSDSPHLDEKSVKDVYLSPSSPHDSSSLPESLKTALAVDSGGEPMRAGIADALPVATLALGPAIDDAPAHGLSSASVADSDTASRGHVVLGVSAGADHAAPRGHISDGHLVISQDLQAIGVGAGADHTAPRGHVLDGHPVTSQDVQAIGVSAGAGHAGTAISELCTPLQAQSTAAGFVQGHEITVPIVKQEISSAPLKAGRSGGAIIHAHHPSQGVSIPGQYGALQAQPAGLDVLDGPSVPSQQDVQEIDVHEEAHHDGREISDRCYPSQERSTAVESIEERDVAVPIIKQAIASAPREEAQHGGRAISDIRYPSQGRSTAVESTEERVMAVPIIKQAITSAPREADVTVSPECHPSRELICAEEPREELLAIAPVSEAEFIEDDVEYYSDGMEFESASTSNFAIEAAPLEAEEVGNLLTMLYVEESPPMEMISGDSTDLKTVSQAEAEAVQALLISDTRDSATMPMARRVPRSSLPYIETRKAPVSEDLVKRVVYTYLMDPSTKKNVPSLRTHGLKLDLLFIMDLTGSQQQYIDSVKSSINSICAEILGSDHVNSAQPGDLRVAFIGFRDHPPQDDSFVTREWDFVSDLTRIHTNLRSLPGADGGGDGPEAVTAALARALTMRWRNDCNRVAVLVSDAPPHGIGSQGDYWPHGVPGVPDPLDLAREMLKNKITLHFIACEPSLSYFHNALDFYRGLTRITAGIVVPLLDARVMSTCIIGSALESLAIQDLINEYRKTLDELVASRDPSLVVKYLHALMRVRGRTADQLIMENIYAMSDDRKENVDIWSSARNLADAKARLKYH